MVASVAKGNGYVLRSSLPAKVTKVGKKSKYNQIFCTFEAYSSKHGCRVVINVLKPK